MRIVSWNIAHREAGWRELAESDYDVALLQEASPPPAGLPERIRVDGAPWSTAGTAKRRGWRAAVVALSDRVEVDWIGAASLADAQAGELAVSRLGTLAAAIIRSDSMEPILAFSMYGAWENPHPSTGGGWIYADVSVLRLISDISSFIGQRSRWAQGMIQIMRFRFPPLKRGLSIPQRLCYASSTLFWLQVLRPSSGAALANVALVPSPSWRARSTTATRY